MMGSRISVLGSYRSTITLFSIIILANFYLSTRPLNSLKQQRKDQIKLNKLEFAKYVPPPPIPPFEVKNCTKWNNKKSQRRVLLNNFQEVERLYPRNDTIKIPDFSWSNVIILMLIYDNDDVSALIQSHFDTWISRMPKDLDLLFVSDVRDTRKFYDIFPSASKVRPRIHLHKSAYANEKQKAKKKTIDALNFIYNKFKRWNKKLTVLNIDPDTFVIHENLLTTMQNVHKSTYPYPVDFGRVDCRDYYGFNGCFTLGGSYGMSKVGVGALLSYCNDPKCSECKRRVSKKYSQLHYEDYFTSLAYQNATCLPSLHVSGMAMGFHKRNYFFHGPVEGKWDTTKNHITIHLVKSPENFAMLQNFYYYDNYTLKDEYRL